jgi:hypothetical protein
VEGGTSSATIASPGRCARLASISTVARMVMKLIE